MTNELNSKIYSGEPLQFSCASREGITLLNSDRTECRVKFYSGLNEAGFVGMITFDGGEMHFEGSADESAKLFIDAVAKQWSTQWAAQQRKIADLERQLRESKGAQS